MNPNLTALFQTLFPIQPTSRSNHSDPLLFLNGDRSTAMKAIVDEPILPGKTGRVWFQASWWYARSQSDVILPTDAVVYVVGRQNITLLVEPAAPRERLVTPCKGEAVVR